MKINKFMLLCIILVFDFVIAKRISELKCEETASLITDPRSIAPYLMELHIEQFIGEGGDSLSTSFYSVYCPATLISENFVLTSATCVNNPMITLITVHKLKTVGDEYTNSQSFTVNRTITHELQNNSSLENQYDYGLIQLNEIVPYQNGMSIFRPACLWAELVSPIDKFLLLSAKYNDNERQAIFKNISSSNIDLCLDFINYQMEQRSDDMKKSHMCCMTKRSKFYTENGSPIVAKIGKQYYLFGNQYQTFKNSTRIDDNKTMIWIQKIYNVIGWIESIVWPVSQLTGESQILHSPLQNHTNLKCGERKIKHRPLMAFAEPTYHGEFPWHVALYKNLQMYICGGTIINKFNILTAGHCVQSAQGIILPNSLTIMAGTHNLDDLPIEAEIYAVKSIIPHPNYTRSYLENDIALLKLKHAIEFTNFIQPICLRKIPELDNMTLGLVAGWGRDEQNLQSDLLRQAILPIRDNFECRASNRDFFPNYLNDHNYCAGFQNGTNVCSGDSGGAMIFKYKSNWYIRGIVSLAVAIPNSSRCDITEMVLFTDVLKVYDWIVENGQEEL